MANGADFGDEASPFSRCGIAILRRLTAEDAEEQRIAEDSGKKVTRN